MPITNVLQSDPLSDTQNRNPESAQHVVIIDDQATGRVVLEHVIRDVSPLVSCESYSNPHKALAACVTRRPDLLITDYKMPQMNGIEVIRHFRQLPGCEEIPIVVVSVVGEKRVRYEALEAGATDFLSKPIDPNECRARCRNLLLLHHHQKAAASRADLLEIRVEKATRQIRRRERETLLCLAKAGEFRDAGTGNHIFRMAKYSAEIAQSMGLSEAHCEEIEQAAPMHDIGKIGIPDHILLKPDGLTTEENRIMQTHTLIGHDILIKSHSPYLRTAARIALSHHERFDGSGYPLGLSGGDIAIEARIVALADAFDALTSARPYKRPWGFTETLEYIDQQAGKHFDPACVEALLACSDTIERIYMALSDSPDAFPS